MLYSPLKKIQINWLEILNTRVIVVPIVVLFPHLMFENRIEEISIDVQLGYVNLVLLPLTLVIQAERFRNIAYVKLRPMHPYFVEK